jgi:cytochrome P450
MEGQIAIDTFLRRFSRMELQPEPLAWRSNLGLRGLNRLPIAFS